MGSRLCRAGWSGARIPAGGANTDSEEQGGEEAEEKRAGAAAAAAAADGPDPLCDDFGFCSAAPPLEPPAQLGSPGLRASDSESLP